MSLDLIQSHFLFRQPGPLHVNLFLKSQEVGQRPRKGPTHGPGAHAEDEPSMSNPAKAIRTEDLLRVLTATILVLLCGCAATGPLFSPVPVPADKGVVYVYRDNQG